MDASDGEGALTKMGALSELLTDVLEINRQALKHIRNRSHSGATGGGTCF